MNQILSISVETLAMDMNSQIINIEKENLIASHI